jgi:hypothetical protein
VARQPLSPPEEEVGSISTFSPGLLPVVPEAMAVEMAAVAEMTHLTAWAVDLAKTKALEAVYGRPSWAAFEGSSTLSDCTEG